MNNESGSDPSPAARFKSLRWIVRIVISAALLALIVMHVGDQAFLDSLKRGARRWPWLVIAITLPPLFGYLMGMLRLRLLLRAQDVSLPYLTIWRAQLIGTFFNQLLPTSVGGDASMVLLLGKRAGKLAAVFSSLVLARMLGVTSMCLLVFCGVAIFPTWLVKVPALRVCVATLAVGVVVGTVILLRVRAPETEPAGKRFGVARIWYKLSGAFKRFRKDRSTLAIALGYSMLLQVEIVLQYWWFSWCLGMNLPFGRLLLAVPLVTLAAMLPISLNGIGVREWVMIWICTPLGVARADAAIISLLFVVANLFYGVIGGIVFACSSMKPQIEGRVLNRVGQG